MDRIMKTIYTRKEDVENKWYIIDASDKVLGRLAAKVAFYLRGKHKPTYQPDVECGDSVIVINASKIKVTGNKFKQQKYYRFSGYPGGLKEIPFDKMLKLHPTYAVYHAIKGMMPRNRLGRALLKNVRIYADDKHLQTSQKPIELGL